MRIYDDTTAEMVETVEALARKGLWFTVHRVGYKRDKWMIEVKKPQPLSPTGIPLK
jgi:hypothetical protein